MSETGFRIFRETFWIGAELFYAVSLMLFLKPFMIRKERNRKKTAAAFGGYLAAALLCAVVTFPQGVSGLLLTAWMTGLSGRLGMERKVVFWLMILYWNARVSDGLMLESLYFLLEQLLPAGAAAPEAAYSRAALLSMVFLISHGALLGLMLYVQGKQIRRRRMNTGLPALCCISLIPVAGILFGQMVSRMLFEFRDGSLIQLYERHPVFLVMIPLLALLFYGGTLLAIAAEQEMTALQEKEAAGFAQRQQMCLLQDRLREAERQDMQNRRMRHEIRGHMMNIRGLAEGGRHEELEAYIRRMDQDMGELEPALHTGNAVTDVILNDKRRQCLEAGIPFRADFRYPETGGYDPFDVGIILQNLLQNALEAGKQVSGGERFITLTGRKKGKFFLIEVRNAFAGEVLFGPEGLPATTKEDVRLHGIGLSNVRRTAERYMGGLELRAERQEFCAAVLLQERSGYE